MKATGFVFSGKFWVRVQMQSTAVVTAVVALALLSYVACGGNSSSAPPPPPPQRSRTYQGSGALFASDFNQDNKPDLLTSDGTMNIGQGDGTFVTGTPVMIPSGLRVVAVADLNGDKKLDLLVANFCSFPPCSSTTAAVLLGNGDGTFQKAAVVALSAAGLQAVAAADLNGDGKADLVGVFNDGAVQVFLNQGDGTLDSGVTYISGADLPPPPELVLGDFNGDKVIDIAVSTKGSDQNSQFGGEQKVLLGNGDGTFQTAKSSIGPDSPYTAVAADFNHDGNLDLAVADCNLIYGCTVYIFLGVGDGTWQLPMQLAPGGPPLEGMGPIAVSDFDGDGNWDLIVQSSSTLDSATGQIFLGSGDGSFPKTTSYSVNPSVQDSVLIGIADFNGDGKSDIAVDNQILLGKGDGTFQGPK